jgi:hypothetical protein
MNRRPILCPLKKIVTLLLSILLVFSLASSGYTENSSFTVKSDFKWDFIGYYKDGLCSVTKNGKVGFIDKNYKIVIKPQFSFAGQFCDGLSRISRNGKYGYTNKAGKYFVQFKVTFKRITDRATAIIENRKVGEYEEK